jgi:hypothetical protein
MNNWTKEELDKRCQDNPSLARANGIDTPVAKSCKGQGFKPDKPTQGDGKPLSQIITNKYHAVKTEIDGIVFDSKKEAERYRELCLLQKAHEIFCLCCHVRFPLPGKIFYEADFVYLDAGLQVVVEDVKGFKTQTYKLKWKLFKEQYGIRITEL